MHRWSDLRSHLFLVGRRSKDPYAGSGSRESGCPLQYPGRKEKAGQPRVKQRYAFWIAKSAMNNCFDGYSFSDFSAFCCEQKMHFVSYWG
jgi:hypothetical protein